MSWDVSVAQIWGSLTTGATMALASDITRQDSTKLARFIRESNATVTYFTPTQFATVLDHGRQDLTTCFKYRLAIFAGEPLPIRLVKAIYDFKTSVKVDNQFGPTETTTQTTCHEGLYPTNLEFNVPAGYPYANCSHYVVNSAIKPVPVGVDGELCIGALAKS